MNKIVFVLIVCILLVGNNSHSQSCSCADNFRFARNKMRENYVGYDEKVQLLGIRKFKKATSRLEHNAVKINSLYKCLDIIYQWLRLFKDGHVSVALTPEAARQKESLFNVEEIERSPIHIVDIFRYFKHNAEKLDAIEGIWDYQSAGMRIAIIRDPERQKEFVGCLLVSNSPLWDTGQVRFRIRKNKSYRLRYGYSRDHLKLSGTVDYTPNLLDMGRLGRWIKINEDSKMQKPPQAELKAPSIRIIDRNNLIITIPNTSIDVSNKTDSILQKYDSLIRRTEHLILDLRGNTGGSTLAYQRIIPLMYTNPIINSGAMVLASPDNIADYADSSSYDGVSDSMRSVFRNEVERMKANRGKIFRLWNDDTLVFPSVLEFPKRISILVNRACASATEAFLLNALQSKKVKLFGQTSAGITDYSDVAAIAMPCSYYMLRYSTSRTNRWPAFPVDNIGIAPHVPVSNSCLDWIGYVVGYWNAEKQ